MNQKNKEVITENLVNRATRRIQYVDTTPEEANQPIINEIRNGFQTILNEFQPKQPDELLKLAPEFRQQVK